MKYNIVIVTKDDEKYVFSSDLSRGEALSKCAMAVKNGLYVNQVGDSADVISVKRASVVAVDPEVAAMNMLTGSKKHFCPEFDGMAIDETCPEFEACLCFEE